MTDTTLAAHRAGCDECSSAERPNCAAGATLVGQALDARHRVSGLATLRRLAARQAAGQWLDRRDFRELVRLDRIYGAGTTDDYCRSWTRDNGCPLHGELCSPDEKESHDDR